MNELTPGANAALPPGDLTVLICHGTIAGAEIDVSAFLVTGTGKVRSDADMCFYGQPSVAGGAVTLVGTAGGETRFRVAPGRVPAGIKKVVFTATIHENKVPFASVPEIGLEVGGVSGRIPCAGIMGLGWSPIEDYDDEDGSIDLDASVIIFDQHGEELESVSFYNLVSDDGSIRHAGDNLTGDGEGDDEVIHVDLTRINPAATHLVFTVTSFQGRTFDEVDNAFARLVDAVRGVELCRYTLREQGPHTGVIMVSLSRGAGGWTVRALGSACDGYTLDEISDFARHLI